MSRPSIVSFILSRVSQMGHSGAIGDYGAKIACDCDVTHLTPRNYRRVKNLVVSRDAIPTLNFWSQLNTQTIVLRNPQVQQYIRILAIIERKRKN